MMFELSNVLNALKVIWALVGCMFGLYLLIGLVEGLITGFKRCHGGKKHDSE